MAVPLRGTQSLVNFMGWVFDRPLLTALEVTWRWFFGIPLLLVCGYQARQMAVVYSFDASGLASIDPQNPWVAAVQLANAWTFYQPHVLAILHWLFPTAALAWVVISGIGRNLVLRRMDTRLRFRPIAMTALQAVWLALLGVTCWGWFSSIQWVAATHILPNAEPDLIGYSMWSIFLTLGFFTAWALINWPLSIAPLVMLLENCSAAQALKRSFRLGSPFTGKLIEINLVMGIVKLALMVVAMVLSAAPLPFSDELGSDAMHVVWAGATVFFLIASDYFQVVRLKSFVEFWRIFRGN